jgi:protein kinase-like protein
VTETRRVERGTGEPGSWNGEYFGDYRRGRVRSKEPGAASVYDAVDGSDRRVWLKVASEATAWDRRTRWRFQRVARRRAGLAHPNLLRVLDSGEIDGRLFVALERVEARTLAEVIGEGPMDPRAALHVAAGIARGLEAGRAAGLVHRDLRPESVFVVEGPAPRALLGDFGLTEPELEPEPLGFSGSQDPLGFSGSQDEVSPEELRGEPVTQASDVYRLGCLLFECLTGTPPFQSELFARVLYAHLHDPPPRATERNPELPPAIDAVVARALAKDPGERPRTPVALVREAAAALDVPVAPPRRRRGRARGRARTSRRLPRVPVESAVDLAEAPLRTVRALAARAGRLRPRLPQARLPASRRLVATWLAVPLAAAALAAAAIGIAGRSTGGDAGGFSAGSAPATRSQAAVRVRSAARPLMRRVDARRAALGKRFGSAPTARRRNAAAARIARVYRDAALDLSVARRSAAAGLGLERALGRAERAWTALAREVRTGRGPRYRAARREVAAAERAIEAGRAQL